MKYLLVLAFLSTTSMFAIDVQFNKFTQNLSYESLENAILENPHTGKRDRWGFTAAYSFVEDPLGRGTKNTTLTPVLSQLHSVQFGLNFALSDRFELMVNSAVHQATFNILGEDDTVLGDTTLALKYQILKRESFAIAVTPYAILATGDHEKFLGGENNGYGAVLSLEKNFKHFGSVLNLGYTKTKDNIAQNIDYEDLYHVGVGVRIPLKRFAIQAEYRVNFTDDNSEQRPNEFHLGGSYQVSNSLRAFASVGLGNSDFENNNDYRLLAGIKGSFGRKEKPVEAKEVIKEVQRNLDLAKVVNFKFASHEIDPSSFKLLDDAAKVILDNKEYIKTIEIEGHTDSIGSKKRNQKLSEKRAKSISDYFIAAGVDASMLTSQGYGESQPKVSPEKTKADRAQNRRVEFKVIERAE